jgi:hypothetical protein
VGSSWCFAWRVGPSTKGEGSDIYLVVNPKLTGRLQLCEPKAKKAGPVHAVLHLSGGWDLRYVDQKKMGQVFATRQPPEQSAIADFDGMGPEALEISREEFKARLKPFRGEIKGILTRGDFVADFGNAYADEILWHARLHPYRKKTSLKPEEVDRLYDGMRACLLEAIETVRAEMGEDIHLKPQRWKQIVLVMLPAAGGFLWWNRNGDRCDQVSWNQRHVSAVCVAVLFRCLPDLRIRHVEVVFPGRAVAGFLPVGFDGIAIGAEFPFESLRKVL